MSTTYTAVCDNCGETGPRIHRNAGGAVGFWPFMGEDIFDEDLARREWIDWLRDHDCCDFKIVRQ